MKAKELPDAGFSYTKNKNAEEEEKTTIANFVAEKGAHIANDWFGDSSIGTLKVTPSSFCSVFRFAPDVGEASAVFNMFGQSCQSTTNLPKAVEAWWEGLHKLIKHDECRPVYKPKFHIGCVMRPAYVSAARMVAACAVLGTR